MDWQPIETAPKDGTRVLVFMPERGIDIGKQSKVQNGYMWLIGASFGFDMPKRTHWMPLPQPPTNTKG